jgi:tetratricopeptide (TPR) repeat protein
LTVRIQAALLSLALLLAPSIGAQKVARVPTRPRLDPQADTNDAHSYYRYGVSMIDSKPAESVRAFYWASRLDPSSGEALYALRTASLLDMSGTAMLDYFDYSQKKRKPEYLALDSLLYRAYTINPFLYRMLDRSLSRKYLEEAVREENPGIGGADLNLAIIDFMRDVRHSGWASYSDGRFKDALDAYAKQLQTLDKTKNRKNKKEHDDDASEIHAERSRIFYLLGNMDSALTEMTAAVAGMRERDAKDLVVLYESKAMYDQSLGMIHEQAKHADEAREAYGQALQEDLSYYAAHTRMAMLQLAQGDTTNALTEMDLAVQLEPNDPVLRYNYAMALVTAHRDGDAATQLMKAAEADPYFAAPHLLLARIADVEQYADDAVREYQQFLALSPKGDPQVAIARTRVSALTSTVASTPTAPTSKP